MDQGLLRELATNHLLPLFSGAELLAAPVESTPQRQRVALMNPCTIRFKVAKEDDYQLLLHRSQKFGLVREGLVTEKNVVDAFVDVVREIEPGLETSYRADLLSTFQRRVVVKAIGETRAQGALLEAIDQLALWATRLYEGKPIVAAFGFVPDPEGGSSSLLDICKEDFGAVMSNGFDTLLVFDFQGRLIGHESLPLPETTPSFTPYRQGQIAAWASGGRIALVLNRLGEILVFKDQQLLFARRSGVWHFLTHRPILTQMARPDREEVRLAIYESALDASFARTGACIGVVTSRHMRIWQGVAPKTDDHLDATEPPKARALAKMVDGQLFQNLDRRLRQELLAIDGATMLSPTGKILAVGAILRVDGGSSGGGRLAAAKALSSLGLGIKVSQDGGIKGFHDGNDEASFLIM
ncbi:MAG: hypothetical protein FDZ69_06505 [Deltaproteobacteria bacterium]|nr:MAG: hypothetical protein FDZ69_06505 [Deltaproteobacteria bacterium]